MAELTPSVMDGAESLLLTCDRVTSRTDAATGRTIRAMFFKETPHIFFVNEWSLRALNDQRLINRRAFKGQKIALVRVTNRNPRTGGKVHKYQVADPPEWSEILERLQEKTEGASDPRQRPREVPATHRPADGAA